MLKCNDKHKTNRILQCSLIFCYSEMVARALESYFSISICRCNFFSRPFPNCTLWTCGMWTNYGLHDIAFVARHQSRNMFFPFFVELLQYNFNFQLKVNEKKTEQSNKTKQITIRSLFSTHNTIHIIVFDIHSFIHWTWFWFLNDLMRIGMVFICNLYVIGSIWSALCFCFFLLFCCAQRWTF